MGLLLAGEEQTAIAWWIMLACLLPSLIWVQRSRFYSVKLVVWLALFTQAVTMPLFYLDPDGYAFQPHRPFGFTGLESLQVFLRLGLFLLVFLAIASLLERVIKLPRDPLSRLQRPSKNCDEANSSHGEEPRISQKTSRISQGLILLVVLMMIPLNYWMFQMGIGITGSPPPELPYKLSGILTYLAKVVVPTFVALLYLRTNRRSLLLVGILGGYSIYLGLCTVSRSASIGMVLVPIIFAFLDRRWVLFAAGLLLGLLGIALATTSREIVHVVVAGASIRADTSLGFWTILQESASDSSWQKYLLFLPNIITRLVGFQYLFLGSQVDPTALGGGLAVWLKTVDWRLVDLGHAAIHQEYLGYSNVPEGFYNVACSIFDYAFWAINGGLIFYPLFAVSLALFLMLPERAICKIACRYGVAKDFISLVICALGLCIATSPGWPPLQYLILALMLFERLPKSQALQSCLRFFGTGSSGLSPLRAASFRRGF
jgi:hypothetical protein